MKTIFNTTDSVLSQYNGREVKILRELDEDERDAEVGKMYEVCLVGEKTQRFQVFEDELIEEE